MKKDNISQVLNKFLINENITVEINGNPYPQDGIQTEVSPKDLLELLGSWIISIKRVNPHIHLQMYSYDSQRDQECFFIFDETGEPLDMNEIWSILCTVYVDPIQFYFIDYHHKPDLDKCKAVIVI